VKFGNPRDHEQVKHLNTLTGQLKHALAAQAVSIPPAQNNLQPTHCKRKKTRSDLQTISAKRADLNHPD
jgi:hypothetical protein